MTLDETIAPGVAGDLRHESGAGTVAEQESPLTHSLTEASEMIGAPSKRWIIDQIRAGRFPARKIGRTWRMTDQDITDALAVCGNTATPEPATNVLASTPARPTNPETGSKETTMTDILSAQILFDRIAKCATDSGQQIPPPLNPDVPAMADSVSACYVVVAQRIQDFREEVVTLADTGKLDPLERSGLLAHYDDLETALRAAQELLPIRSNGPQMLHFPYDGKWDDNSLNHFADHAKHVYAVGERDIAALQYRLGELVLTGRLDAESNDSLQGDHCYKTWDTLRWGTTAAVRDQTTCLEWRSWFDNTYSDGRPVMIQILAKNWDDLDFALPFNKFLLGDGPILEHPWASICHINPVIDPG